MIVFAHDQKLLKQNHVDSNMTPIQLDQICHISTIFETGEDIKYHAQIDEKWCEYFHNLCSNLPSFDEKSIRNVSTSQFTRKQLLSHDDFHD